MTSNVNAVNNQDSNAQADAALLQNSDGDNGIEGALSGLSNIKDAFERFMLLLYVVFPQVESKQEENMKGLANQLNNLANYIKTLSDAQGIFTSSQNWDVPVTQDEINQATKFAQDLQSLAASITNDPSIPQAQKTQLLSSINQFLSLPGASPFNAGQFIHSILSLWNGGAGGTDPTTVKPYLDALNQISVMLNNTSSVEQTTFKFDSTQYDSTNGLYKNAFKEVADISNAAIQASRASG